MIDATEIAETLESGLRAGMRYDHPYDLTVFTPFSPEVYRQIIDNLPDDSFYEALYHKDAMRPDGTSTRMMLSLEDVSTRRLPPKQRDFWSAFNTIMRSREVCEVFLHHLEPQLTARFGAPISEIPCYPSARLGRDADGYRIRPHPDSKERVYTAQVYLPSDESQVEAGTSVYARKFFGLYSEVRKLPFKPNTAFCFARTDRTFHGVHGVSLTKPRNNLHISCFSSPRDY